MRSTRIMFDIIQFIVNFICSYLKKKKSPPNCELDEKNFDRINVMELNPLGMTNKLSELERSTTPQKVRQKSHQLR